MKADLQITSVRGYVVQHRLAEPQGNASGYYDLRSSLVVEIVGAGGVSGWGETWHSPWPCSTIIQKLLAALVVGADAASPRAIVSALLRQRGYDRGGLTTMAISAIEMAIWDLRARSEGVPISTLLGGALRARAGAYAAGPYFKPGGDPYRNYLQEVEGYLREGFRAVKTKIGINPRADAAIMIAIREAAGDDVALMADANQGLTRTSSLETSRRLESCSMTWLEEPVPPEDLDGYSALTRMSSIPISAGEASGDLRSFGELLKRGVAILQPDLSVCGGFLAALDVAALAKSANAPIVPHVWGTGINMYATLQLIAVLHETTSGVLCRFPWLEMDRSPNPLRTLWGEPALAPDGTVGIPTGPGLGIDIQRADLTPYLKDHWVLEV